MLVLIFITMLFILKGYFGDNKILAMKRENALLLQFMLRLPNHPLSPLVGMQEFLKTPCQPCTGYPDFGKTWGLQRIFK